MSQFSALLVFQGKSRNLDEDSLFLHKGFCEPDFPQPYQLVGLCIRYNRKFPFPVARPGSHEDAR